jgi:hypothetical protein
MPDGSFLGNQTHADPVDHRAGGSVKKCDEQL